MNIRVTSDWLHPQDARPAQRWQQPRDAVPILGIVHASPGSAHHAERDGYFEKASITLVCPTRNYGLRPVPTSDDAETEWMPRRSRHQVPCDARIKASAENFGIRRTKRRCILQNARPGSGGVAATRSAGLRGFQLLQLSAQLRHLAMDRISRLLQSTRDECDHPQVQHHLSDRGEQPSGWGIGRGTAEVTPDDECCSAGQQADACIRRQMTGDRGPA